MASLWEVVGGGDAGGILVREGKDLKSAAASERLATASIVEQLTLEGDRLNFKLVEGTGPETGWVSTKIKAATLLVKKEAEAATGGIQGPGEPKDVEVDEALKKKIEEAHKKKKEDGAFDKYCFKYKPLGFPAAEPKLRVLCFHNAGSAESVYTQRNTPFTNWVKEAKTVEICAFDYPGRDKLQKDEFITSAPRMAEDLMAVIYDKLTDGVPYIIWGHSVGTWVSFEFMVLVRKLGLPMPQMAFLNAFPAPHMPEGKRAWRKNKGLNNKQMQEELRMWDKTHFDGPAKTVFDEKEWPRMFEPMIRADFCLFDEYRFTHDGFPKFPFPIHSWHFSEEHYNTPDQIEMWRDWTSEEFDFHTFADMGHLTCMYVPEQKNKYFQKVVDIMKKYV